MNDLVDSTAFLISTASDDPWVTAVSVLKAISVSLRNAETSDTTPSLSDSADWIELQIEKFAFSALELKCTSSLAIKAEPTIPMDLSTTLPKSLK